MSPKPILVRKLTVFRVPWEVWIHRPGTTMTYQPIGRFRTWAAAMQYAGRLQR